MLPQFSLCKKLNLLNSLCFPCLEKLTAKFPVFPVPWPPCKSAKCKECHKIGHFHKVCQSKKRGRRAHLVQTAPPQTEQDTHIDENGVRQPNPSVVNMLKIVNHIGATKGSQEKHLKFPIDVDPRGPYKHHLVVRVDTGADVNCMNEKTFKRLFPKVKLSVCPHRDTELWKLSCRHFYTGTVSHLLAV